MCSAFGSLRTGGERPEAAAAPVVAVAAADGEVAERCRWDRGAADAVWAVDLPNTVTT